ncbi:MAG: hypothetical protein ThorAB25_17100 [Candidatus Thorarchaeota archaeon AB_25]|nr:MAG: hypothetical protein ThorAB25_17100 [Candidatus Thorarchaeota archaeon AB_25]
MSDKDPRKVGPVYRVFAQDLYFTSFHHEEIGFRQAEMWRSKSRQFSRDADIVGKIMERRRPVDKKRLTKPERVGFIILRQSLWKKADQLDKRLVVKLFSNRGGWIATMEEMVAEEYAMSFAAGLPLVAFTVLSKENEIVTWVKQIRRGGLSTESYAFYILGPDKTFEVFRIEGIRATPGDDFRVIRLNGRKVVANIDSRFGDLGGDFIVRVKDPVLAENEWFCRVLQCFSVMVNYRERIRKKIRKGLNQWKKSKIEPSQHRYEISLLANPRKLTLKLDELEDV